MRIRMNVIKNILGIRKKKQLMQYGHLKECQQVDDLENVQWISTRTETNRKTSYLADDIYNAMRSTNLEDNDWEDRVKWRPERE